MKKGLFPSVAFLVLFILLSGYVKENKAQTNKDDSTSTRRIDVDLKPYQRFFKLQSGVDKNLNAISYFNPARGIVVGDNGTILLTKNGAHDWQSVGGVTSVNLYGAATVDSLIAIAVGEKGTILRSTDGGMTWGYVNSENVKFPKTLRAVAFYSKKEGYAVGDSGVVFFTNNGGEKWHRVHGDRSKTLNAISFNKKNMPCIVGKGTFGQSTDHGKNWNFTGRTVANLRSIHFLGPDSKDSLGFAVGDNGVILKTTNGGRNWNSVKSHVKMNLNGVFLHSPKLGYAVGDSGTVLRYNGKTWEMLTPSTTKKLNAVDPVYLNPTSTCVGENGEIMLVNPPPCSRQYYCHNR